MSCLIHSVISSPSTFCGGAWSGLDRIYSRAISMAAEIPGPRPWPLVGNLPNIDLENSIQSIVDIGKQYGDLILGPRCVRRCRS